MPPVNVSLQEFAERCIAKGESAATAVINTLFASNPAALTGHEGYKTLSTKGGFNQLDKDPAIGPMLGDEAANMAKWPAIQLEEMREALHNAVLTDTPAEVSWGIDSYADIERIEVEKPVTSGGKIRIRLISPGKNIQIDQAKGNVTVLVGS